MHRFPRGYFPSWNPVPPISTPGGVNEETCLHEWEPPPHQRQNKLDLHSTCKHAYFLLKFLPFRLFFLATCSLGVQPGLLVMRAMYSIKSNNTLDFNAFPPSYVPTSRLADPECVHGSGVRGMEGGQEESTAAAVCQRDHAQRRRQPQEQVSLQHFCSTFLQLFIGFCQM